MPTGVLSSPLSSALPPHNSASVLEPAPARRRTEGKGAVSRATQYTLECTVQCTVHSAQCTVYSTQCTVHCLQCTVNCAIYCTVHTAQCTLQHCALCTFFLTSVEITLNYAGHCTAPRTIEDTAQFCREDCTLLDTALCRVNYRTLHFTLLCYTVAAYTSDRRTGGQKDRRI